MKKQLASALFITALLAAPTAAFADNTASGTGIGVLGDTKTISTWYTTSSGTYYLEDHTKPMTGIITTYNANSRTSSLYYMTDVDNVWNTSTQRAGVDANYYAAKVYDWWKLNFNRNSYDDQGSSMISVVHYATAYNNAYWDGEKAVYGDGDGTTFRPFSGDFDIVAWIWSKALIESISPLPYAGGQIGAIVESWADAFAVSISSSNWLIGEDCYTPSVSGDALRSLSNPPAYGQPDHMANYVNTTSDNGGVHTNSGIPNKAFYNFATAIGSRTEAAKVWYIAMKDYMTSTTASFSDARAATLVACAQLKGINSSYYAALQNAWTSVGIN